MLSAHTPPHTLPNQRDPATTGDFIIENEARFVLNSPQRWRTKATGLAQVTLNFSEQAEMKLALAPCPHLP